MLYCDSVRLCDFWAFFLSFFIARYKQDAKILKHRGTIMLRIMKMLPLAFIIAGPAVAEDTLMPVVDQETLVVPGQTIHAGRVTGQYPAPAALLSTWPGLDLRVQGIPGGQADLSLRGSSFSGAGLSLNGFSLPNAQTEHFNVELPLPPGILSEPTVYTGFEQTLAGEGHLTGTVDFSLLPLDSVRSVSLGVLERDGYWNSALIQQRYALRRGRSFGVGAFAGTSEANALNYRDNDLRAKRVGGQLQSSDRDGAQWDLVVAREEKVFGARGYYGVNPEWGAREETGDTFLFSGWTKRHRDGSLYRISALYREQSDDYRLFWDLPGEFRNEHTLRSYGLSAMGQWLFAESGTLDWRLTAAEQRLRSSALGDHRRARAGAAVVPGMGWGAWRVQAGARAEIFEDDSDRLLPQGLIAYQLTRDLEVLLAYSESVRQPSYTELNYESPASLGNAGLGNETAATTEVRLMGQHGPTRSWSLGAFHQRTRDSVDWIRLAEDTARWEAQNLGTVDTVGVEVRGRLRTPQGLLFSIAYSALHKSVDLDYYSSRYTLDYPEHLLQVVGYIPVGNRFAAEVAQSVRRQVDNPLRQGSATGYDADVLLHARVARSPRTVLTLGVRNVWDDDYEEFPGQSTAAPRRWSVGMTVDW